MSLSTVFKDNSQKKKEKYPKLVFSPSSSSSRFASTLCDVTGSETTWAGAHALCMAPPTAVGSGRTIFNYGTFPLADNDDKCCGPARMRGNPVVCE